MIRSEMNFNLFHSMNKNSMNFNLLFGTQRFWKQRTGASGANLLWRRLCAAQKGRSGDAILETPTRMAIAAAFLSRDSHRQLCFCAGFPARVKTLSVPPMQLAHDSMEQHAHFGNRPACIHDICRLVHIPQVKENCGAAQLGN